MKIQYLEFDGIKIATLLQLKQAQQRHNKKNDTAVARAEQTQWLLNSMQLCHTFVTNEAINCIALKIAKAKGAKRKVKLSLNSISSRLSKDQLRREVDFLL